MSRLCQVEINIPNRRRLAQRVRRVSEIQFTVWFFRDARPNVSRRGAAPSLDVASVDPLILGRDLQARDAPARDAPTRYNAHSSLPRFRFCEE